MNVFISHAYSDEPLAHRLAQTLERAGLRVWDARDEVLPGDNWAAKAGEALEEAEAMIVLLTPDALRSSQVRREIYYALGKEDFSGRLFPVLVGPKSVLTDEAVPWILRNLQMIHLTEQGEKAAEEEAFGQITRALLKTAERQGSRSAIAYDEGEAAAGV